MGEHFRAFICGMGKALDITGAFSPRPQPARDPWQTDAEAIRSDWERVGEDLRSSMETVAREAGLREQTANR
jgi:hypothetical protein